MKRLLCSDFLQSSLMLVESVDVRHMPKTAIIK